MKLRTWRLRQGLTQEELAEVLGTARASVNRYENGRMPTRRLIRAIHKLTKGKVTANDFIEYGGADDDEADGDDGKRGRKS
jgi:transcriptional regulator with XRE-family HTH domain